MAVNADAELLKVLAIPDGFRPVASVVLGYAAVPNETEKELKVTIAMNRV